jgi:hypothetical protein
MAPLIASADGPDDQPLKPQWIALNIVKADDKLQPRVGRDPEHQQRMARSYEEGEEVPPAVHLYYDGKFYWLADGFHRFHAMWSLRHLGAKFQRIKAFVHRGTKEQAIACAAVANLDSRSKPMTDEDRKKAMWMLMDLPEWRKRSATALGKKFSLSSNTSRRYWIEYFSSRGLLVPEFTESENGSVHPTRKIARKTTINTQRKLKNTVSVGGKSVYLGRSQNLQESQSKLDLLSTNIEENKSKYDNTKKLVEKLTVMKIHSCNPYSTGNSSTFGLFARSVNRIAITCEPFRDKSAAPAAFGRAMHAKAAIGSTRAVVLCPVEDGPRDLMDDYTRAYGVEWMTVEDFIESLKAE